MKKKKKQDQVGDKPRTARDYSSLLNTNLTQLFVDKCVNKNCTESRWKENSSEIHTSLQIDFVISPQLSAALRHAPPVSKGGSPKSSRDCSIRVANSSVRSNGPCRTRPAQKSRMSIPTVLKMFSMLR